MRTAIRVRAWAVFTALLPAVSFAATVFEDDFESGATTAWTGSSAAGVNSFAVQPEATKAGARGLRFDSDDSTAGAGPGSEVYYNLSGQTPELHLRLWFRRVQASGTATFGLFAIMADLAGAPRRVGHVSYSVDTGYLSLSSQTADGGNSINPTAGNFLDDNWHLFELTLKNINTGTGIIELRMDGGPVSRLFNLDWAGYSWTRLRVGPYEESNRLSTGVFDYDEVRLTTTAEAQRLMVVSPGNGPTQVCVPIEVFVQESSGAASAAPFSFNADLSVSGVSGDYFGSAACSGTPVSQLAFAAGASSSITYFRPLTTGTAVLSAAYPDFLSVSGDYVVDSEGPGPGPAPVPGPDPESPYVGAISADPWNFLVGCGCGAAGGQAPWQLTLLAALGWLRLRRTRRS